MDSGDGPPGKANPSCSVAIKLNITNLKRLCHLEPIRNLRKTMTRTLRNFDSAGEDVTSLVGAAGDDGYFDPPARERPAVSCHTYFPVIICRHYCC